MTFLFKIYVLSCISYSLFVVQAQSFLSAISAYPQLSNFTSLLSTNPGLASSLLSFSASAPQTVLVPDDGAFQSFEQATGKTVSSVSQDSLQPVIQYHILSGLLTAQDFAAPEGITVPTGLTGPTYNNRTAGAALSSVGATTGSHDGQVVFIAPKTSSTTFKVRQLSSPGAFVQSGRGQQVNLTAIDGSWDGGSFHIVDGFLTLPEVCTATIRAWGLSSLDASLNRTGLSSVLDHINNVTCLGPSDEAFLQAGSPDVKADTSVLTTALMFHTIPEPLYSNFLTDGQTFKSFSNATVRVTFRDGAIFFNDAKMTKANVITNNGLMHVLDRVMSPLEDEGVTETILGSASTALATIVAPSAPSATLTSTAAAHSTVGGNATVTTSGPIQVTGAASVFEVQPRAWRLLEVLGVMYGYMFIIV